MMKRTGQGSESATRRNMKEMAGKAEEPMSKKRMSRDGKKNGDINGQRIHETRLETIDWKEST